MFKFKNEQDTAYRKLQSVLNEAMKNGEDEYSDDDGKVTTPSGKEIPKFRLPKRLRGWMFLERSRIPPKDMPAILNQTKTTHIDKLQQILVESYPDKIVRDMDSRQHSAPSNKHSKTNYVDDGYDQGYDHDEINNVDDEEDWESYGWTWDDTHQAYYNDDGWYDETYDEQDEDDDEYCLEDENEVAFVDEEGLFIATEEVIDHIDQQFATEDKDYAQAVVDFNQARNMLARARVARGFYPVVVPTDSS